MTLASFPFSAFECQMLHLMAKEQGQHDNGSGSTATVKFLELALALAYVIYDAATTDPPGVGTTMLISLACLAEALLLCFESYTFYLVRQARPDTESEMGTA